MLASGGHVFAHNADHQGNCHLRRSLLKDPLARKVLCNVVPSFGLVQTTGETKITSES